VGFLIRRSCQWVFSFVVVVNGCDFLDFDHRLAEAIFQRFLHRPRQIADVQDNLQSIRQVAAQADDGVELLAEAIHIQGDQEVPIPLMVMQTSMHPRPPFDGQRQLGVGDDQLTHAVCLLDIC
jgi:hypothetical protein